MIKRYQFNPWSTRGNEPIEAVLDIKSKHSKLIQIICMAKYQSGNYVALPLVAKTTSKSDCFLATQVAIHSDVLLRLVGVNAIESTGESYIIDKQHFCEYRIIK